MPLKAYNRALSILRSQKDGAKRNLIVIRPLWADNLLKSQGLLVTNYNPYKSLDSKFLSHNRFILIIAEAAFFLPLPHLKVLDNVPVECPESQ